VPPREPDSVIICHLAKAHSAPLNFAPIRFTKNGAALERMKKCANCSFDNPDDAMRCQSCNTTTFISASPESAGGHIISPAEGRYWERMTFRQFAIVVIRIQALWFLINAALEVTYLPRYFVSTSMGIRMTSSASGRLDLFMLILRMILNIAGAIAAIQFAERILSWLVKDSIPKAAAEPPAPSALVGWVPPLAGGMVVDFRGGWAITKKVFSRF
jgi:hypothetical protein